ncbi:MAG: hypothetical protein KIT27_09250 [Legionellales bacterium]|nr:hypothetical protein [Legionellales bacterium]
MPKLQRDFVSELDHFLEDINQTISPSASQLAEIKKHQRISQLRDHDEGSNEMDSIWQGFNEDKTF